MTLFEATKASITLSGSSRGAGRDRVRQSKGGQRTSVVGLGSKTLLLVTLVALLAGGTGAEAAGISASGFKPSSTSAGLVTVTSATSSDYVLQVEWTWVVMVATYVVAVAGAMVNKMDVTTSSGLSETISEKNIYADGSEHSNASLQDFGNTAEPKNKIRSKIAAQKKERRSYFKQQLRTSRLFFVGLILFSLLGLVHSDAPDFRMTSKGEEAQQGSQRGIAALDETNHRKVMVERKLTDWYITDVTALVNKLSMNGNAQMGSGDSAILQQKEFRCSDGTCHSSGTMMYLLYKSGEVRCEQDGSGCILDGEHSVGLCIVDNGSLLTIRSLTFKAAEGGHGALGISYGARVDIVLCTFTNCRETGGNGGGGAIELIRGTVNVYATLFSGNIASSGNGNDIYRNGGTITIHNTCPSPYTANTPTQGETRTATKRIASSCVEPFITPQLT